MRGQLDNRISELEKYVDQITHSTTETQTSSYLCRFGAVLVCGFIERSVEIVILDRLTKKAQPQVLEFIKSHFRRGTNYNCANIEELFGRFDHKWRQNFSKFIEENADIKEGIASAFAIRNSVAHGGSASIGIKRLKELVEIAKRLVDALISATS